MNYLIRHAQTDANLNGIIDGWFNMPINKTGVKQAAEVARKVAKLGIKRIISSDLLRPWQTAEIINNEANLGLEIELDSRLREIFFGSLEGKKKGSLGPHDGEELEDLYIRIREFIDDMKATNIENTLIATHGGPINMFLYCAEHDAWNPQHYVEDKTIANCRIFEFPLDK